MPVGKKEFIKEDVVEMARERIRHYFKMYDNVVVSFSGGKDSTCVLNMTLDIAREMKRLPLPVVFFDEECLADETIEYVERIRKNPDLDFRWYCVELKHRNACSDSEPYWITWDKKKKDKWCRNMPKGAITDVGIRYIAQSELPKYIFPKKDGTTCVVLGLRTQESLARHYALATREKHNDIATHKDAPWISRGSPIYDWGTDDVWRATRVFGWDYNRYYDLLNLVGVSPLGQRVCPPFGEEPLRGLHQFALTSPNLWEKMLHRVAGANTAALYARTYLYGKGKSEEVQKDKGKSWEDTVRLEILKKPEVLRPYARKAVNEIIKVFHKNMKPDQKLDDEDWSQIIRLIRRTDSKGRLTIKVRSYIYTKYGAGKAGGFGKPDKKLKVGKPKKAKSK